MRASQSARRVVLGVDPGTLMTGYGIVEQAFDGSLRLVAAGTISNHGSTPMQKRLAHIYDGLQNLMQVHHPNEFAIETSFYGKNAQSALKLGQARGVSLVAASGCALEAREYSPREVKLSVVGTGAASKRQVQYMVRSILHGTDMPLALDASDAIAVALCHLRRSTGDGKSRSTWKAFLAAHPERVLS